MKKVIEKLHKELSQYLSDVEKSSPSHILLESYQIEMKCHLVSAMIYIADNGMLPEAVWTHLLVQNCPLDYLYELWICCRKLSGPTCWSKTALWITSMSSG